MLCLRRVLAWAAACSAAAAWAQDPAAPPPMDFAITGVTVEAGDGKVIANATVVARGGLIASVEAGGNPPAGLPVVDGRGKTLYPGFIDGFSSQGLKTFSQPGGAARPDTGTQAFSSMWLANRKGITPEWRAADNLELKPDAATYQTGVTAALLGPAQGGMRGTAALVQMLPGGVPERVLAADAASAFSFRLASGPGYPSNLLGAIALLRQTLMDAQSLRDGAELWPKGEAAPAWAAALTALEPVVSGKRPVLFEANFEREILRAIALSEEFGFPLMILGGRDAGPLASLLAEKKIPVVLNSELDAEPPAGRSQADVPPADQTPEGFRQERRARWEAQARTAQDLIKAGVPVLFASSGSMQGLLAGVQKRVQRGLPREAALRCLTSVAAEALGAGAKIGSIAPGKAASMVLMDGDFALPSTKVAAVWVDGRPVLQEAGK